MDLIIPGSGLVIWQIIGFTVLLVILAKFAWRPILAALEERETSIENALKSAEVARNEMANMYAENEKLLMEARIERDQLLKSANEASARIIEEAKDAATKEGAKMIQNAKAVIETEKQAALTEVRIQVARLSFDVAEKLLRKNLSSDTEQKALVEKFVKDIKLN